MQYLYMTLILIFSLSACDNNEQKAQQETQRIKQAQAEKDALLAEIKAKDEALHQARLETKKAKEKLLQEEQKKKEAFLKASTKKSKEQKNEKLSNIGITIKEHKITIDTNQTKKFFQNISQKLGDKLRKITQNLEKGMLDEKNAGVKIDKTHINIDLNKTKDFLDAWGQKMQNFVKEFDDIAKKIDTETQQIQNMQTKEN